MSAFGKKVAVFVTGNFLISKHGMEKNTQPAVRTYGNVIAQRNHDCYWSAWFCLHARIEPNCSISHHRKESTTSFRFAV